MKYQIKGVLAALSLGAMVLTAAPAMADPDHGRGRDHGRYDDHRGGPHWDRDHGRHDNGNHYGRRPGPIVYRYDWNRPDPRYRGYYAERYYRGGYDPIRVTRSTRIYRGYDNRYYCRRSDGTTGLILGAALGGLLGNSLDRGGSDVAGTLIGAGTGALLGREIDRGSLVCR